MPPKVVCSGNFTDGIKSPFSLPRMISNYPRSSKQLQNVTNTISTRRVIISLGRVGLPCIGRPRSAASKSTCALQTWEMSNFRTKFFHGKNVQIVLVLAQNIANNVTVGKQMLIILKNMTIPHLFGKTGCSLKLFIPEVPISCRNIFWISITFCNSDCIVGPV